MEQQTELLMIIAEANIVEKISNVCSALRYCVHIVILLNNQVVPDSKLIIGILGKGKLISQNGEGRILPSSSRFVFLSSSDGLVT
jgi:hypothetical protein